MSASGEDTKNLNKEGESPAATILEGIPNITPTDVSSRGLKDGELTPLTSKADYLEDPGEVEAVIEKKLLIDKEKALDVDSELDFELKWDDDTDLNENQGDDDIDLEDSVDKDLESDLTSIAKDLESTEKETESVKGKDTDDLNKEIDSAFTSTDLDSLHKETGSSFTSMEKDLDSIDKEIDSAFTSTEKDLDKCDQEIENNLISIEKDVDTISIKTDSAFAPAEKEIDGAAPEKDLHIVNKDIQHAITSLEKDNILSTEKDLGSVDKPDSTFIPSDNLDEEIENATLEKDFDIVNQGVQHAITSLEKDAFDEIDGQTGLNMDFDNAMDVDVCEATKAAASESEIELKDSDVGLQKEGTLQEDKTISVDSSARIERIENSPIESETNSLDEELIYSDAEAPDIEDKELMDEIDAEIAAEINKDKLESTDVPQVSSELLTIEEETKNKTTEKETSDMDVDINLTCSSNLAKSDLNDTCSSVTDLETSTYDINKEHGLDRPDVMIEIPTQELIDSFDDSDIDGGQDEDNKLDQSQTKTIDKPDLVVTETKEDIQNLTETQAIEAKINLGKNISDEVNEANTAFDMLLTDEVEKTANKPTGDTVQTESMEVDTHDVFKEIDKPEDIGNTEFNSIAEPNKQDQGNVSSLEDKVSHADLIIEATTEQPEDVILASEVVSELTKEVKEVELSDLKLKEVEDTALATLVDEAELSTSNKDVESTDNSILKEDKKLDSHVDEAHLCTSSKEDVDFAFSDDSKLKEDIKLDSHLDTVQLSTSTREVKDIELSNNTKRNNVDVQEMQADEPQPSTSIKDIKDVESPDTTIKDPATQEIHEAEPSSSTDEVKDVESSDNSKVKAVETHKTPVDEPQSKEVEDVESLDDSKLKYVETQETPVDEPQPSTSKEVKDKASHASKLKQIETDEAQPTTSNHSELSDEDQEATDSLGLLAESSRVMDDDDEQEQEPEPDDDDDDDDFDQDDGSEKTSASRRTGKKTRRESNQMTAEHSEDSNAQQSEADVPREVMDVDESNDAPELHDDIDDAPDIDDAGDENDEKDSNDEKEESNDEKVDSNDDKVDSNDEKVESNDEKDESNDERDESNDERDDLEIQIGDVVSQTELEAAATPGESEEAAQETEKAIEAILEDKKEESTDVPSVAATIEDKEVKPTDTDSGSAASSKLRQLLLKDSIDSSAETSEAEKKSPSKTKKLEISKPKNEINIVELEESSSEDDIQVVQKPEKPASPKDVTSVNIPAEVEVMSAAVGATTDMRQQAGEVVISGLPKPAPHKPARLNTDEVSIRTTPAASLVIPETTPHKTTDPKASIDFGLEIYSLDSDDEETEVRSKRKGKLTAIELDKARQTNKCINMQCTSDGSVPLVPASMSAAVYYAATQQRGGGLCLYCAKRFEERSEKLIEGVKDLTPFLSMDMCMIREEFVEISDSDSEDEPEVSKDDEIIGEKGAKFLEEHLANVFNDAWKKFNMEERLLAAQAEINVEVGQLEEECKQIDEMLNECQKETDKLRNDLYSTFADDRRELPAITICDTPNQQWSGLEEAVFTPSTASVPETREQPARAGKRRAPGSSPAPAPAAKRPAIPLGYAPLQAEQQIKEPKPEPPAEVAAPNDDDNADISVVKLSVEAAPAGLPPPGVATRPPLRPNMLVFAMRNTFGAWHKVKIIEVQPKLNGQFTMCRVRFEQPKTMTKLLPARCLAYEHPPDVRLTIGTRVVALFKDHRVNAEKKEEVEKKEAYYSGIVAEIPNPVNSFRYLIFFDDGYAQYVQHSVTRLVCECAPRVWDEVHPFSRQFVRDYLRAYPERPMVRLHAGQSIKTEWDGKWWVSKVLQVDASLVLVYFEGKKDNKTEWIYRGSTRLAPLYLELQAAERTRARPLPRAQAARRYNMPYVEYTRSDEPAEKAAPPPPAPAPAPQQTQAQIEQEIRRQRAVAKKSTAPAPAAPPPRDTVTSRVVFYTPKNAIRPYKMTSHTCSPKCKRSDVLALKDLRTYNPLTKPLLSGWERQQVRFRIPAVKAIMYRAPCGRRIRDYKELHQYLQAIDSDMGVDLFDFNPATHCLAEFLLNKCLISKKDLSHGKENVPVPCVNYYDSSLPEFCSYNTERTPTAGVPLNLDPEFLCGCDCTDDCADKSKCACWKMTLEGARTIGLDTNEVGYVYKRLPEPLPSGIYECNVRCKCKQTCLNRVAQHPLQLKLQVFKTANRGWGIRALNDVPKGAFLCVYAGNLLTDATANLDGLNEGDEYLAELDYIEVVEQMKEGFEEDIPEDAKKLDEEESESSSMSSSEEEQKQDGDDDFRPAMPAGKYTPSEYSKRLRKREKSKKAKEKEEREKKEKEEKEKDGEDCITISDDEELREPAHFAAQAGMKGKEFVSKYKSVRTLFGRDEACYIMDAKVQGNIGRYLNHSCTPNVFVQNVFVDTHDPRFPWVAFFALSQIRAGTELTWNYNYDVGSVPGKVLYCYCNAPNCRGRLL